MVTGAGQRRTHTQRRLRVSKGTTHHSIRVDDKLWDEAKAKAKSKGDNLSEVIREALRSYVQTPAEDT